MKILITFILVAISFWGTSQTIKFKIEGQADTTINLVRYYGKGLYYADTAEIKKGIVEFDGSKQKPGILAIFLPGQKMLEFVYNDEEVYIESDLSDLMNHSKVKKSEENKIFLNYVKFVNSQRSKANSLVAQRKNTEKDSEEFKQITNSIDATSKKVKDYQLDIIKNHPDMLVAKIVKMSMDIEIPDAPLDEKGNMIDSNFRFNYYRAHYFDNVDFNDDRLVRTPIYHNKLEKYFSPQMMVQHWDTILHYAFQLCDKMDPSSDMYQYNVSWITSNFEKSKIMGMDKVFVMMAKRYYCGDGVRPEASWVKKEKLEKLCEKATKQTNLVMGAKPPNIILRDTTDVTWKDFYSIDAEYTILYFWDPECGHCKKVTPKLQTLYAKKFKERNIEIFAVGKAIGEDFEKWKKFIRDNNLQFTNVAVTDELYKAAMNDARQFVPQFTTIQSLNYQQTYDIYATPKVFVLDKDKKIIAKSLSISQLENLLDRLQNKTDSEVIFPLQEKTTEEEEMH